MNKSSHAMNTRHVGPHDSFFSAIKLIGVAYRCMGCGASSQQAPTNTTSTAPPTATKKAPMATVDHLNILLQEDLTIRG